MIGNSSLDNKFIVSTIDTIKKYAPYIAIAFSVLVLMYGIYRGLSNNVQVYIAPPSILSVEKVPVFRYIEIKNGCGPYFDGDTCVNVREGPGTEYPVVFRLRTGVVLRIGETVTVKGKDWYKIIFASELLYPERVKEDLYVSAEFAHLFYNEGDHVYKKGENGTSTKRIVVDISEQKLYAYDGDVLFMEQSVSTGLELTPTSFGTFYIFKMTPSRFMQGPIPNVSDQVYDLPGVPWNLYFTTDGAVIHGAYWHDKFGEKWSHGCVNLPPQKAKELYMWAEINTKVIVQS